MKILAGSRFFLLHESYPVRLNWVFWIAQFHEFSIGGKKILNFATHFWWIMKILAGVASFFPTKSDPIRLNWIFWMAELHELFDWGKKILENFVAVQFSDSLKLGSLAGVALSFFLWKRSVSKLSFLEWPNFISSRLGKKNFRNFLVQFLIMKIFVGVASFFLHESDPVHIELFLNGPISWALSIGGKKISNFYSAISDKNEIFPGVASFFFSMKAIRSV